MEAWQQFFDAFAERYDEQCFTLNTAAEIEFIVEHARLPAGGTILDVGCGTGRHSVPLAARGYRVTGVDLSPGMLAVAEKRAAAANVDVEWVQASVAEFARPGAFDAAICCCEGGFGLLTDESDALEHDAAILRNIATSLRPGGVLILNALNAARVLRSIDDDAIRSGRFDPVNLTEQSEVREHVPDMPAALTLRERYYTAPEIRRMARSVGLTVRGVYGGTAGNWGLRPIELDEYELMLIAER
jgi:SAM-dependent methyltransferase